MVGIKGDRLESFFIAAMVIVLSICTVQYFKPESHYCDVRVGKCCVHRIPIFHPSCRLSAISQEGASTADPFRLFDIMWRVLSAPSELTDWIKWYVCDARVATSFNIPKFSNPNIPNNALSTFETKEMRDRPHKIIAKPPSSSLKFVQLPPPNPNKATSFLLEKD